MGIFVLVDRGEFASQTLAMGRRIKTLRVDVQSAFNEVLIGRIDFCGLLIKLVGGTVIILRSSLRGSGPTNRSFCSGASSCF